MGEGGTPEFMDHMKTMTSLSFKQIRDSSGQPEQQQEEAETARNSRSAEPTHATPCSR